MNKDWLKQDLLVYEIKQQGSTLMEAHVKGILRLSDKECTVLEQARDLMEDLAEQMAEDLRFQKEVEPDPVLWFRQHHSDWW